jgi:hypothetical protein
MRRRMYAWLRAIRTLRQEGPDALLMAQLGACYWYDRCQDAEAALIPAYDSNDVADIVLGVDL